MLAARQHQQTIVVGRYAAPIKLVQPIVRHHQMNLLKKKKESNPYFPQLKTRMTKSTPETDAISKIGRGQTLRDPHEYLARACLS